MAAKRSKQSKRAKLAGLPKPKKSPRSKIPPKIKKKAGAMEQVVHDRPKMLALILERVGKGEFVTDILKDIKVAHSAFYVWVEETEETQAAYARAKVKQSHSIADEIQAIADGEDRLSMRRRVQIAKYARRLQAQGVPGWRGIMKGLEGNLIARNRLQMDARKWYARALNPKAYGDKVDVTSGGESVKTPAPLLVQFVGPDGQVVMPGATGETPGPGATGRE